MQEKVLLLYLLHTGATGVHGAQLLKQACTKCLLSHNSTWPHGECAQPMLHGRVGPRTLVRLADSILDTAIVQGSPCMHSNGCGTGYDCPLLASFGSMDRSLCGI